MIRFSSLPYSEQVILCKKVFTQAAAARILSDRWGVDLSSVARKIKVRPEWEFIVWVHVPGYRPLFVSKMTFIQHFMDFRISSSTFQNLIAKVDYKYPQYAWIESWKENGTRNVYTLDLNREGVRCDCHDFSGQEREIFVTAMRQYMSSFIPACKHVLRFLYTIDIHSQRRWIENQRWADRWVPQPSIWDDHTA